MICGEKKRKEKKSRKDVLRRNNRQVVLLFDTTSGGDRVDFWGRSVRARFRQTETHFPRLRGRCS
ncbi:hypothetical protein Sjap_015642 [Stephania japonica]|uniref:Uncharacterized protein n=1 Tax=Stephania japonica TaxID=461633 RepID=A0AAP0NT08_9MAGN